LEARLQATDDLGFEAALIIGCCFTQPTMKLLRQAKADHPMSQRAFHQRKASDDRSNRQADDETSDNGKGNGLDGYHGDTPPIISARDLTMVTDWMIATD
jgi:hypothetical protein